MAATAAALLALLLHASLVAASGSSGDTSGDLVCSACRFVVSELHATVEREAIQGRTVEAGSFRVDSHGNQRVAKIPYARSDTHLTGALESACEHLPAWGHTPHPNQSSRRGFVPLSRTDGRPVDVSRITSGSAVDNWVRMRCESLLDDHEETLKSLLRQSEPLPLTGVELERRLCLDAAGVCTEELLAVQFEAPVDLAAEQRVALAAKSDAAERSDEAKDAETTDAKSAEDGIGAAPAPTDQKTEL